MTVRAILLALSIAVVGLVGCEAGGDDSSDTEDSVPPPELPFAYHTEHLDIHSDIERCEGDLARWEGFIEYAEVYTSVSMPESVDMYVWEGRAFDGPSVCGGELGGCFRRSTRRIYCGVAVCEHELVHAVTADLANHDSFFIEGLAEALFNPNQFGQFAPTFPVTSSSDVDYASAGHFVRWLLETYGPTSLIAHMSAPGGVAEFEAIYKVPLEDMIAAYFTTAAPKYPALYDYPTPDFEPVGDARWSSTLDFSCDHDDIRGTDEGRAAIRRLTIPKTGSYAFWTSTGGPIYGRAKSVTSDEDAGEIFGSAFDLPPGVIAIIPVNAGIYEIRVIATPGVETGVVMVWSSLSAEPVFPGGIP